MANNESRVISELATANQAVGNNLLLLVTDANTANANNRKITVTAFFGNVTANIAGSFQLSTNAGVTTNTLVITNGSTPANSTTVPSVARHFWWDESYLYVVANTSSNTIKRVALSSF